MQTGPHDEKKNNSSASAGFTGKIILHRPPLLFYKTDLQVTAVGKEFAVPEKKTAILHVNAEGKYQIRFTWNRGNKTQTYEFKVSRMNPIQYYDIHLEKNTVRLIRQPLPEKYNPNATKYTDSFGRKYYRVRPGEPIHSTETQSTHGFGNKYYRARPGGTMSSSESSKQRYNPTIIFTVDEMSGNDFEHFCADLLYRNGFTYAEVTSSSGDHGADVLAVRNGIQYAIQCKRSDSKIGNKAVQEAFTGKAFYKTDIAVVLTNNYFTKQAINDAARIGVELWDRDFLKEMLKNRS